MEEKLDEEAQVNIADYLGLDLVQNNGEKVTSSVSEISTEDMRALSPDPFEGEVIQTKLLDMGDYSLISFFLDSGYKVKLKIEGSLGLIDGE